MDILSIMGAAPGPLLATISHGGEVRQLRMNVARHPNGGWHVRQACGGWGPRCHAVPAAILMEASAVFTQPAASAGPAEGGYADAPLAQAA